MDAKRKMEGRLALEPSDVRLGLLGANIKKVAIEVVAGSIFARAAYETGRIQNWTNKPRRAVVKKSGFK